MSTPSQLPTPNPVAAPVLTPEQATVLGKISAKFTDLGISASFVKPVSTGPILSVYRFMPSGSTKVSHIEALGQDLAIALGVEDVLVKRMPGESAVGIFIPNLLRKDVDFKDAVKNMWGTKLNVPLNFGVDLMGERFIEDLSTLPHLLVAGSTGTGKSTAITALIASIIACVPKTQVELILSDTKAVEFTHFHGAPHLKYPIATTPLKTIKLLQHAIDEMEDRLKVFSGRGVKNVHELNALNASIGASPMPFIVIIIDEMADMLMDYSKVDPEEKKSPTIAVATERLFNKIVQKARATGIYMIGCTQRPSVDVISGTIKANFPARLAFRLPSSIDSRTILNTEGAEHLLSLGDMLYSSPTRPGLIRLHAPYAKMEDIKAAVEMAIQKQQMEDSL